MLLRMKTRVIRENGGMEGEERQEERAEAREGKHLEGGGSRRGHLIHWG